MDKIIIINNENKYFANSLDEVITLFFGKEYLSKSFNEKYKIRYEKALGIAISKKLDLVDTRVRKIRW